jgi:hypothetical protein
MQAPPQPEALAAQSLAAHSPPAPRPVSDVQRQFSSPASRPAAAEAAAEQEHTSQTPAGQEDDWSWIGQDEWNHLKSVMAGHQEKTAHEKAEAADVQLSPEEIQRIEAGKQVQAELARRQELARAGQLPRAQVVYLSSKEKAGAPAPATPRPASLSPPAEPVADASAGLVDETSAAALPGIEAPETSQSSESRTSLSDPGADIETPEATAGASEPDPTAASETRETGPAPYVMAAAEETQPAPEKSEAPANVGRRLLRAAKSLFRRPDDDEETSAAGAETDEGPQIPAEQSSPESKADPLSGRPLAEDLPAMPESSQRPSAPAMDEQDPGDHSAAGEVEVAAPAGSPEPSAQPDIQREARADGPQESGHAREPSLGEEPTSRLESTSQPDAVPVRPSVSEPSEPKPAEHELDEVDTVIAPLPLQEVWPVEEKPAPPGSQDRAEPGPMPATSGSTAPPVQRKAAGGDQVGEDVHSALRDVAPGQRTDSSIELVTPRRPRLTTPEPKINRQVDDGPPAGDDRPAAPLDRLTPVRPEQVAGEPSAEPYMVETEIGELPSDLWGLLGERPPTSQTGRSPTSTAAAAVQREIALAENPVLADSPALAEPPAEAESAVETHSADQEPGELITQLFRPPVIQRVDAGRGAIDDEMGQAAAAADEVEEPAGEEEIDVDRLARQVLPEIKRRLEIDWERGRGRLL